MRLIVSRVFTEVSSRRTCCRSSVRRRLAVSWLLRTGAGGLEAIAALDGLCLGHPVAGVDVGRADAGGGVGALGLGGDAALGEDRESRQEAENGEQARHAAPHDPLIFGPAHGGLIGTRPGALELSFDRLMDPRKL
jgi:hypothetical protein